VLPTRGEWLLEGELVGHRPSETIAYLAACAASEDDMVASRTPWWVISPPTRWWPRWWRRLFGWQ
jgi:hypothetical protein